MESKHLYIWFLFGGWILWSLYTLGGIIFCLSLIGIPYGFKLFTLSWMGWSPIGKAISDKPPPLRRGPDQFMTIIWMFPLGVLVFLTHALCAIFFFFSFVWRPLGREHLRLVHVSLQPFLRNLK
ncbi:MAG: hypothetical protein KTR25_20025 [Myxococcales bacterium]|nr:hypothetical protein [Myxococcales bacterium]